MDGTYEEAECYVCKGTGDSAVVVDRYYNLTGIDTNGEWISDWFDNLSEDSAVAMANLYASMGYTNLKIMDGAGVLHTID
jgi:hypothetical protein